MANKIVPSYPAAFDMPFAHDGDKQEIPQTSNSAGKATLIAGFPEECSKPLELNGVPPMRTDMNGILNLLSQWAFYAQSGGVAKWDATVNYVIPSIVYLNGVIYSCIKDSGPATTAGSRQPGASGSEIYWTVGLGDPAPALFGNNANLYIRQGTYWIEDAQAATNFPRANIGGWLSVLSHGNLINQSFFCRDSYLYTYMRHSVNGGSSWNAWVKMIFASELYNGAYTQIFMSTAVPNDSQGKNGDIWYTYI